jgi:hypothetical protein
VASVEIVHVLGHQPCESMFTLEEVTKNLKQQSRTLSSYC